MMLVEVRPSFSRFDQTHRCLTDTVFYSDDTVNLRALADSSDRIGPELRKVSPTFDASVAHVVFSRTKPQVPDEYTDWSVTRVQDMQTSRDWSVVCDPTGTGREHRASVDPDTTVARRVGSTDEVNTIVRTGFAAICKSRYQRHAYWRTFKLSHDDVTASLEVRVRAGAANAPAPETYQSVGVFGNG